MHTASTTHLSKAFACSQKHVRTHKVPSNIVREGKNDHATQETRKGTTELKKDVQRNFHLQGASIARCLCGSLGVLETSFIDFRGSKDLLLRRRPSFVVDGGGSSRATAHTLSMSVCCTSTRTGSFLERDVYVEQTKGQDEEEGTWTWALRRLKLECSTLYCSCTSQRKIRRTEGYVCSRRSPDNGRCGADDILPSDNGK